MITSVGKSLQCPPSANIEIAGGGIGGLAVGVSLRRLGHTVTIYGAASELVQVFYDCSRYGSVAWTLLRGSAGRHWHSNNPQRLASIFCDGDEELSPICSNVEDQLWLYGHDI